MNHLSDINWYAVQAKRFRESFAALTVTAMGLEVFLPMARVEHRAPANQRRLPVALFPGYLFARFNAEVALGAVESAPGVLRVLKYGRCATPVADEIVREIQSQADYDGLIQVRPRELKPGDQVSIQEGPLAGMVGKVLAEPDDRSRVIILLEALWQARVLIGTENVETAAA